MTYRCLNVKVQNTWGGGGHSCHLPPNKNLKNIFFNVNLSEFVWSDGCTFLILRFGGPGESFTHLKNFFDLSFFPNPMFKNWPWCPRHYPKIGLGAQANGVGAPEKY
jgi:hypothetical protein